MRALRVQKHVTHHAFGFVHEDLAACWVTIPAASCTVLQQQ
jgi:hypothetical protein